MNNLNLWGTKIALDRYDAVLGEFQAKAGDTPVEEIDRLSLAIDQAAQDVRRAFADDTADRNSRENAMLVNPDDPWLRTLVVRYARELPTLTGLKIDFEF